MQLDVRLSPTSDRVRQPPAIHKSGLEAVKQPQLRAKIAAASLGTHSLGLPLSPRGSALASFLEYKVMAQPQTLVPFARYSPSPQLWIDVGLLPFTLNALTCSLSAEHPRSSCLPPCSQRTPHL